MFQEQIFTLRNFKGRESEGEEGRGWGRRKEY